MAPQDRLARERDFHDDLARQFVPAAMPPKPPGPLDLAVLVRAGALRGRRVLDLGCGTGDFTLALAQTGAETIAVDLSPGMVEVARKRVQLHTPDAKVEFFAAPAEELPIPDGAVDVIVGRFILHHLDVPHAATECARVLAPGGIALFAENSGRNPLLRWARAHLTGRLGIPRYGTADERPLAADDIEILQRQLPKLEIDYPVFDFFVLFDRQILRFRWRRISRFLKWLDRAVWRWVPPLRRWSFRVLVVAER